MRKLPAHEARPFAIVLLIYVIHALAAATYSVIFPSDHIAHLGMLLTGGINVWIMVYFCHRAVSYWKDPYAMPRTWRPIAHFLGECPQCLRLFVYPKRRRLNTAYANEESNYIRTCGDCYQETCEHYQELWDTYYSGIF